MMLAKLTWKTWLTGCFMADISITAFIIITGCYKATFTSLGAPPRSNRKIEAIHFISHDKIGWNTSNLGGVAIIPNRQGDPSHTCHSRLKMALALAWHGCFSDFSASSWRKPIKAASKSPKVSSFDKLGWKGQKFFLDNWDGATKKGWWFPDLR